MQHAVLVRIIERRRDVPEIMQDLQRRKFELPQEQPVETFTRQVVEHDVGLVAVEVHVENGDDVRMTKLTGGSGFTFETIERALQPAVPLFDPIAIQDFERNDAVDLGIFGAIDDTHRALPDLIEDLVFADSRNSLRLLRGHR